MLFETKKKNLTNPIFPDLQCYDYGASEHHVASGFKAGVPGQHGEIQLHRHRETGPDHHLVQGREASGSGRQGTLFQFHCRPVLPIHFYK